MAEDDDEGFFTYIPRRHHLLQPIDNPNDELTPAQGEQNFSALSLVASETGSSTRIVADDGAAMDLIWRGPPFFVTAVHQYPRPGQVWRDDFGWGTRRVVLQRTGWNGTFCALFASTISLDSRRRGARCVVVAFKVNNSVEAPSFRPL
ncbi:uncharacterized protein ARMOST_21720 [Armillaria ostoyae]|uniref:Uncharacterized protein n=1 Tax=Armillaria ostoyae TaxID=47428 RepID=A0A284REG9_ARMOS|nr:uncharacterized protein ARMOST_10457 [Armillaria ostoyae]SJL18147.1 uncharacterized protein ARMOST_21720 [Armillaria ostoyae]